jgi:hypothetical protein
MNNIQTPTQPQPTTDELFVALLVILGVAQILSEAIAEIALALLSDDDVSALQASEAHDAPKVRSIKVIGQ